jgi:hypothetical protein
LAHLGIAAAYEASLVLRRATRRQIASAEPVHFIALVGDDQGEVRQAVRRQVGLELVKADDMVGAMRIALHGCEVHEAGVLRCVKGALAAERVRVGRVSGYDGERARRGQLLVVALPPQPDGLELLGQIGSLHGVVGIAGRRRAWAERILHARVAIEGVVVMNAEGVAPEHGHVVRLAWVHFAEELRRIAIAAREAGDVGRRGRV